MEGRNACSNAWGWVEKRGRDTMILTRVPALLRQTDLARLLRIVCSWSRADLTVMPTRRLGYYASGWWNKA